MIDALNGHGPVKIPCRMMYLLEYEKDSRIAGSAELAHLLIIVHVHIDKFTSCGISGGGKVECP